jgi:hypothetical protein
LNDFVREVQRVIKNQIQNVKVAFHCKIEHLNPKGLNILDALNENDKMVSDRDRLQ